MEKQEMMMSVASENRRGWDSSRTLSWGLLSSVISVPHSYTRENQAAMTHTPPRDACWPYPESCPQSWARFTLRLGPSTQMMPTFFPGILVTISHP